MKQDFRKVAVRGIATLDQLKARCIVDAVSGCWVWQGAQRAGTPAIHTFDHARCDKHTLSGARAAWNIAFGRSPRPGCIVFRACWNRLCVSPHHLREAKSRAEMALHQKRTGSLKGTALESRRATVRIAQMAAGVVITPAPIVLEIRAAPKEVTGRSLAHKFDLSEQTISRIRRGVSHREVMA